MTTVASNLFKINGVIDTSKPVMENINNLALASNCWITYDIHTGKWSPIINRSGTSEASFNDSNIIGSINMSTTGLTDYYNRVELSFPHKDLYDQRDFVVYETPEEDRFPNEVDQTLTISTDCFNDPVQASLIATRELKQNRIDKIIEFTTDYSKLSLSAGAIIDVTNDAYGFNQKLFRVISVAEADGDDGAITVRVTALEYSDSVYNTDGLIREERGIDSGIISKMANATVLSSDYKATSNAVSNAVSNTNDVGAAELISASLTQYTNLPGFYSGIVIQSVANTQAVYQQFASNPNGTYLLPVTFGFFHANPNIDPAQPFKFMQFNIEMPKGDFVYTMNGVTGNQGSGNFASYVYIYYIDRPADTVADLVTNGSLLTSYKTEYQTATITWADDDVLPGYYYIIAQPITFNDLSVGNVTPTSYTTVAQGSGGGFTVSGFILE